MITIRCNYFSIDKLIEHLTYATLQQMPKGSSLETFRGIQEGIRHILVSQLDSIVKYAHKGYEFKQTASVLLRTDTTVVWKPSADDLAMYTVGNMELELQMFCDIDYAKDQYQFSGCVNVL
jgi:hypothetical protein